VNNHGGVAGWLVQVRLSLLVDAAEAIPGTISSYLKQHLPSLQRRTMSSEAPVTVAKKEKSNADASASSLSSSKLSGSGAAAEARRVMSNYGLVNPKQGQEYNKKNKTVRKPRSYQYFHLCASSLYCFLSCYFTSIYFSRTA